ncbi:3-hydroxyacyl-CoA dehydrogenase family protein [Actinomadura verrucosospora]|uniref:3-hydroxyacyl-CoA dehydrogenase n=1 Tax=Actinomadura verrucosospora TaxID=46165 RepID=A0A7D3ZDG4_ACTVE|nr:3-hydroxyacyl-CoA dehydrogenase family protein [Actinomadura verrucosospora]QKG20157.1 3-hydroxyacyl-CoA dehydrogenase [Actinomadura verrucosospora]
MTESQETRPLAVLGAGVMGVGITALFLGHRRHVVLIDTDESKLDRARAEVAQHLRLARLMGALPRESLDGELMTSTGPDAVAGVAAVIEAVIEESATKTKALSEAAAATAPGTPLVSNTSSIPIDELGRGMSRPEDLVGVHFMNPPYLIATVEVVQGPRTGTAAMAAVRELLADLGRRPVVVGDGPGFVTSRILHRMINDAARIVAEGRASAADVDTLLQDCLGHRTGPLRTADLIGLDNLVDSLRVLHERTGDDGCRPCDLLLDKVRDGDLGRKSGRGFYDYLEARP